MPVLRSKLSLGNGRPTLTPKRNTVFHWWKQCRSQRRRPPGAVQAPRDSATSDSGESAKRAQDTVSDTLSSLDAFLGGTSEDSEAKQVSGSPSRRLPDTSTAAAPQSAPAHQPADRDNSKLRSSSGSVQTSVTLVSYAKAAWTLGLKWFKDYIKPTTIVNKEDSDLPRAKPRFAYMVLLLNIVVYAVGLGFRLTEGEDGPTDFFLSLASVNEAVEAGEYYRIVTANFLHDSFVHLGLNSYALLTIAPEAESVLGGFVFLTAYILGGSAGTVLCFLLTDTLTVGASSGIFSLIGAVGAFLYKNHKVPHSSEQLLFMAGLVFFNVFLGGKQESAIDNLGHLGGLLCGIYVGTLLTPAVIKLPLEESDGEMGSAAAIELDRPRQRSPERATSAKATVVQPDPFQSLVVVLCISLTLSSSVAATVLNRTGELPFPRLPPWLG